MNKILKKRLNLLIHFLIILFYIHPAYAYLDPGTFSILIQGLIGFVVTCLLYIKKIKLLIPQLFRKFINFFKKI